jgi:zinc transport system substrate-binding protein
LTIIILISLCAVVACKQKDTAKARGAENKITVTSTIFAPYDFTRAVAGDKINLVMLLPPASESHSFEPTPRDIIGVQHSDIFIYIGGESDAWVDRILDSMKTENIKIIKLMDNVDVVEEEIVEGMEDEEEGDDPLAALGVEPEAEYDEHEYDEHEYDEHIWTSPKNAVRMVNAITEVLCAVDTVNAEYYQNNAASYIAKLDELDAAIQTAVDNGKRKTIIFGDRFPFRYFADRYGLKYFAAFPGCSTETEPSAATVAFLINKIKSEKIPVVFHIELSNEKMADTISEETGAKKLLLHACHNISKKEFENGVTYLDLMKQNVESIKEALK